MLLLTDTGVHAFGVSSALERYPVQTKISIWWSTTACTHGDVPHKESAELAKLCGTCMKDCSMHSE